MSRIKFIIGFILVLAIEIIIGAYANSSGIIRCYGGDVLVVFAIYFLIRIFTDRGRKILPAVTFVFACVVEGFQGIDIVGRLGIKKGSLLATIIGTSGDWLDVLSYAIGIAVIYILIFISDKKMCRLKERGKL